MILYKVRTAAVTVLLCFAVLGRSQPPAPAPTVKGNQPENPARSRQQQTSSTDRGTEQSPIVVKVITGRQADHKSTDNKANALDQPPSNWWMIGLTAIIIIVYGIQTRVFWVQATRLKQTIDKMEEISSKQTNDMKSVLAESARSATAMEGIAKSMASNVESVKESVTINRGIAERQKLISELQSRAYLSVTFDTMVPQDDTTGVRFQPYLKITNLGNTPAYKIRFHMEVDVAAFPTRDDFRFTDPSPLMGISSPIGPGLHKIINAVVPKIYPAVEANQIIGGLGQRITAWGRIEYKDAFTLDRYVDFGFTFFRMGDSTTWMCVDTERHNDSN